MVTEFKLIAALLDYPSALIQEIVGEVPQILQECRLFEEDDCQRLIRFANVMKSKSLLDWQQLYCETFDVAPVTSLYLFEHVYGSSTKRGSAMCSLKEMYHDHGLEISNGELPDYLPCYLDFLSTLVNEDEALGYLRDISKILDSIAASLERNESPYSDLIYPLLSLAKQKV